MSLILLFLLLSMISIVAKSVPIGSLCTSTSQCTSGAFCSHSVCRRASCQIHGECAKGELCFYGKADGEFRDACFPLNDHKFKNFAWCPGNGEIMKTLEGKIETCDFESPCSSTNVCNPIYGVCCSKLRTCPAPMLPVVEVLTGKPILCKLRGSPVLECPLGSHCQAQTGFCCTDQDLADKPTTPAPIRRKSEPRVVDLLVQKKSSASVEGLIELPTVGHSCKTGKGCAYGAVCQCLTQNYQGDGNEKGCRCECPKEMGYTLAVDGKTCKRSRRKLKRKVHVRFGVPCCLFRMHFRGCRCKSGFQRDGNGGCKPIAFKCVNQAEALKFDGRIIGCVLEKRKTFARYHQAHQEISSDSENLSSGSEKSSNSSNSSFSPRNSRASSNISESNSKETSTASSSASNSSDKKSSQEEPLKTEVFKNKRLKNKRFRAIRSNEKQCPNQYYCVALFDIPKRPNFYQGFCCPIPDPDRPQCPVGDAHESSKAPNYGCQDCPWDHYCHLDGVATQIEVCCPKPCVSPEDVFVDGQCHPLAHYGDACNVSEQCLSGIPPTDANSPVSKFSLSLPFKKRKLPGHLDRKNIRLSPQDEFLVEPVDPASTTTDILLKTVELECRNNECTCPAGYFFNEGDCKHLHCSIGFKGEPSVDSKGDLLICKNSQDCGKGSMCEPADKICCKGTNRCPKGYVETGELCGRQEVRNSHPAFTAQVHNSARQPRHQQEQECAKETDICIIPKHTKEKICCTEEDI